MTWHKGKLNDREIQDWLATRWEGRVYGWPRYSERARLAHLAMEYKESRRRAIEDAVAEFEDRAKYPERPMLRIGGQDSGVPVLWLLGWRPGDFTPIHDHDASEVAIRVLKGSVEERVWWPEAEVAPAAMTKSQRVTRELHEGSLVTVPAPYIHRVGNPEGGPPLAATLHAYYPTLSGMRYFEEGLVEDAPCLREVGRWAESGHAVGCPCPHEPASCGDRGCHTKGG